MAFNSKKYFDKQRRIKARDKELHYSAQLALINNELISQEIRQNLRNKFTSNFKKNASFARVKNRCLITNRAYSVIRFFKLSRLSLREKARNGDLLGVVRSSW